MHIPLVDPVNGVVFRDLCMIFNMDENTTAILCMCRSVDLDEVVRGSDDEKDGSEGSINKQSVLNHKLM
jgi:hypothetical protein